MNIFICHKKILTEERDGRQIEKINMYASLLHDALQDHPDRYEPWIDRADLQAGMAWEMEIYRQLLASDVLLVAIGPGTSQSEWVKREIALAKALQIAVLPIGYDIEKNAFVDELRGLEIGEIQGRITHNLEYQRKAALIDELHPLLERASAQTAEQQTLVLNALEAKRRRQSKKADDNQKKFSLTASLGGSEVRLHVASGDLTRTRGIDVLVNSENDYMQMARFFESRTVSCLLRRRGAATTGGRYVDSIQRELDDQLGERSRPVQVGEVVITSAGAADGELAEFNESRYVFHVAAVQAVDAEARVVPFSRPFQIEKCVRRCLVAMRGLNEANGIVSPDGSEARSQQESRATAGRGLSSSILFPIFGSGQGGNSVSEAFRSMLGGLIAFFESDSNQTFAVELEDVYFSAYTERDVAILESELRDRFR